jgi:hypothetical protein
MSNLTIKPEYLNKTVKVYDRVLGSRTIVVAKIDMSKVAYYQSIGLGYLFEEATVSQPTVIKYEAIEGPIPEPTAKPKKKRKKPSTDSNA